MRSVQPRTERMARRFSDGRLFKFSGSAKWKDSARIVDCGQVPIGYNHSRDGRWLSSVVICGQVPIGYNEVHREDIEPFVVICGQVPIGYNAFSNFAE